MATERTAWPRPAEPSPAMPRRAKPCPAEPRQAVELAVLPEPEQVEVAEAVAERGGFSEVTAA